ncbi:SAM-dependent methyltransferase [Larkinella bovis]|uniref:SAM-dependent methyltransferase n=1 Tax=Larkinella bovis TaxID=683041 RepID=A0ABW0IB93_9BACT
MANQQDLAFTYSTIDRLFRLSMGQTGDYSGAMYNGNFKLTLEQAQQQKHRFIADSLHIGKGSRLLDMGCGWGPFLRYAKERGALGRGVTLSSAQASGRLDYIETIGQWRKRFRAFNLKKYALYLSLLPRLLTNQPFQDLMAVFRRSPNRVCFQREIMDHYRLVFEKV